MFQPGRLLRSVAKHHHIRSANRSMATANHVQLDVALRPAYRRPGISVEATKKASELLQDNHEKYHIFFNNAGFHNHLAHQMLTMWALNASPEQLNREYMHNTDYQRPSKPPQSRIVDELQDSEKFIGYMGRMKHYNDYLEFFRKEIDKSGWQNVLQRYVFARDERAEAMFARMYASIIHPIIHLGFGIEFQQPAIIAEALAQAAVHEDDLGVILLPAEQLVEERNDAGSKSILQLLQEIRADNAARPIDVLSQVRVKPEDLEEKTAEMTNTVCYYTAAVNRRPIQPVDINFFWMHAANCSIFFTAFLKQDGIAEADKIRLLEWKIRVDLLYYMMHGRPELSLEGIRNYNPRKPSGWEAIEDRICAVNDDGHKSKLIRALASGAKISKPYEGKDAFPLKDDDWLQFGHMAIDGIERPDSAWSRW